MVVLVVDVSNTSEVVDDEGKVVSIDTERFTGVFRSE